MDRSEGRYLDLVTHLVRTTPLPRSMAERVVEEVVAYYSESVEAFIRRRHRELQARGLANPEIFQQIVEELRTQPVAAPAMSARQVRRVIYG
jgi:hypothetical protein